jgi:hypothetical protein
MHPPSSLYIYPNLSPNHSLNQLTGIIPEEFGSLLRLEKLGLGGNKLQGIIPQSFARLSKLNYFDISLNPLLLEETVQAIKVKRIAEASSGGAAAAATTTANVSNGSNMLPILGASGGGVSVQTPVKASSSLNRSKNVEKKSQLVVTSLTSTSTSTAHMDNEIRSNLVLECKSRQEVYQLFLCIGVVKQQRNQNNASSSPSSSHSISPSMDQDHESILSSQSLGVGDENAEEDVSPPMSPSSPQSI